MIRKKLFKVAGVVIIILIIWFGYLSWYVLNHKGRQELPMPSFVVKEYSLSGKVITINNNIITLSVGRLFKGDNGNYIAYEYKQVIIDKNTIINKVRNIGGKVITKLGTISDLMVAGNVIVFSNLDIAKQDSFTPSRLDILQ